MKMDFSRLMASTATALDKLQGRRKQSSVSFCDINYTVELGIIVRWIRVVRTFFLCSVTLDGNLELRIEANNVDAVTSRRSRKKRMKQKNRRMRKSLGSLLVRVEDVVRRILDDRIPYEPFGFQYDMESLEEEMDEWYTRLSDYLRQYSTSPVANQIKVITDSVLENLKDYLSTKNGYDYQLLEQVQLIESVIKNISFLINFTRFGTLLCAENKEFHHSLTQIELLAIGAGHLTLHLFSNVRGTPLPNDLTISMVNPFLHETCASALASLKLHSQESHNPTLDLNDYPFVIIMEDFTVSLLSTLWEILQFNTAPVVSLKEKLQTVYEGLRYLRNILKNQPDKFDDDKIRDITVAAICEAGVMIFSLYRKDFAIDHADQNFSETIKVIRLGVEGYMVKTNFPQTNVLGFIDYLLEDCMVEVEGSKDDSDILSFMPKIKEYLVFLKSFVGTLLELRNQQKNVHQDLWNLAIGVAYKIEFLIDQFVVGDTPYSFSRSLQSITEDIMAIKADSLNIFYEIQEITWPSTDKVPSVISSPVADEVVGFKREETSVINRLMGGLRKLQVVAVVGMPGLGKTTLATKVYRDPSVTYHFHVKAWCSVSQVFDRRKVLLELLNQIQPGESNLTRNEEDLSQQLWRSLRKRKYLIFVDDIWDIESFNLLRESLPDDSNQSRILLTSRHGDIVPEALHDDKPLFLRHLTVDESLELLQKKLFPAGKDWPPSLHEFGMEIAEHCKGLPLTVVIIAGLLKTTEQEGWNDVLQTLRSSVISDLTDQCGSTIELSYQHLPDYLKPCFLWFGAFPEDHEVSVKKLIWIWIAEGFVRKSELKSLEDVAADYLKDLIGRSLVMIVKERTTGGVKACRIHDLLHDFCLRKANEDHFLHLLKLKGKREPGYMSSDEFEFSSFHEPNHLSSGEPDNPRRLCLYVEPGRFQNYKLFFPRLRSLLFFTPIEWPRYPDLSFIISIHKLLRVLDMEKVFLQKSPSEVGHLVLLRYLAFQVTEYVCPAIGKLTNLETLVLYVADAGVVSLPDTLWNLQKLRHLHSKWGSIELPIDDPDSSCSLLKLETLSTLCVREWIVMEKQLRKFPNIRQMKCQFHLHKTGYVNDDSKVKDFSFLSQVNSLSLCSFSYYTELIFPDKIKKLTLSGTNLPWNKIPSIAKLPYLEVLKLLQGSFYGDTWHVEEGEFSKLKYLKLQSSDLVNWTATSDDLFSNLEKLVLVECYKLEEVPECLENVTTLETIEVIDCPDPVVCLVKKVEESQKDMGNSVLQFHERRTWRFFLMRNEKRN